MKPEMLIPVLGLSYAALMTVIAIIEREGVSIQFVGEVTVITILATTGGNLLGSLPNPILFLAFTYLLTMRSRLLSDVARLLTKRERPRDAIAILQVAQRLLPDKPTRILIDMNLGIAHLRLMDPKSAQALLESAIEESTGGGLGLRNRTACHYFLGHALIQQGQISLGKRHFREASELFPPSPYARAAEKALAKHEGGQPKSSEKGKKKRN